MNPTLETALALAAIGIPTFPCRHLDKRPATANGFHDATTDEAQLRQWFADGSLNLAMPTGAASGLVALDFDLDAATDKNGEASWRDTYSDKPPLPPTLTVTTPRGGRHLFFRAPAEAPFPNSTSKLAAAVDTRGEGGYVLIPPSATAAGSYIQTDPTPPAELPAWIAALLCPSERVVTVTPHIMPKATPEDVKAALAAIPAGTNYTQWVRIGMALHQWNPGAEGLAAWDAWSSGGGDKYHPGECARKWKSFDTTRGVTAAALFGIAKEHGHDQHKPATIGSFAPISLPARQDQTAATQTQQQAPGALPAAVDASDWIKVEYPPIEQILEGAFDMGAKAILVAPSKMRKSFFMTQGGLCIAAGRLNFLTWRIPTARRVLMLNLEISPAHYQKRLKRMMDALHMTPDAIKGRLFIVNARGYKPSAATMQEIADIVARHNIDLIIIDPIYKLVPGDESDQAEVKALLNGLDSVCVATGAALWFAHHAGKGEAGDRQAIDRTSGSGVWARDFDCQMSLVSHVEDGLIVCEQIARNYPPKDAETLRWTEAGAFEPDTALPVIRTTANRRKGGFAGKKPGETEALAIFATARHYPDFVEAFRKLGASKRDAERVYQSLRDTNQITYRKLTGPRAGVVWGTPEALEILAAKEQESAA